jgi:hypothetical protein
MTNRALMVVAKQPAPGQTKTRLSPPFNGEQASALYECFLKDTLEIIRAARQQIAFEPIITYLPPGAEGYFGALAPDFGLLLQQGADLSERLNHATTHCLTHGFDQAVIMDSDSPTLPAACLVQAFAALDNPGVDVCFGRCDDGGYYLIGLKRPAPPLFLSVTMSTPTVAEDTLDRARAAGLNVELLPTWFDIDYADDLKRLARDLRALPDVLAPHTRAFLSHHAGALDALINA